jgi:hypothetical protein
MGKYVLLLVMAAAGVWALAQQQTTLQTAETEVEREEEVLARQAARTGLNSLLAETRTVADDKCPDQIVESVDSRSGTYETDGYHHGTYEAWLEEAPGVDLGYRAHAKGQFPDQSGATVTLDRLIQRSREGLIYGGEENRKLKKITEGSEEFGSAPQVRAMGPYAEDLDGDGKKEIPYVRKSNQKLEMVDADAKNQGDAQELVPSEAGDGAPLDKEGPHEGSRLAVGNWDGSGNSVFYINDGENAIYQVTWEGSNEGGSYEELREVPNEQGNSVVGIGNIDDDSGDELVFVDGEQLHYIEGPGEKIEEIDNGGVGGGNAATLADLDGDGRSSIVFEDGSNDLGILNVSDSDPRTIEVSNADVTNGDDGAGPGAFPSSPTVLDIDGDGNKEIAYVVSDEVEEHNIEENHVQYVDANPENVNDSDPNVSTIRNISAAKRVGLQAADAASTCGN